MKAVVKGKKHNDVALRSLLAFQNVGFCDKSTIFCKYRFILSLVKKYPDESSSNNNENKCSSFYALEMYGKNVMFKSTTICYQFLRPVSSLKTKSLQIHPIAAAGNVGAAVFAHGTRSCQMRPDAVIFKWKGFGFSMQRIAAFIKRNACCGKSHRIS